MSTKFKRILFDYDGTILIHKSGEQGTKIGKALGLMEEQIPIFAEQLEYFFAAQNLYYTNLKVTYDLYYKSLAWHMPCIHDFGLTPKQVDEAVNLNNLTHSELAPGVKETLEYLSERGYVICLMTNGFLKEQSENMKYNGIYDYFDRIYTWDNCYAKPDLRFMNRALAGTNPSDNVIVGNDRISDILMGKKAGAFTIGFNLNAQPSGLSIKPDVEILNFSTLTKIL